MKSFLVAVTFALVAGLGVLALQEGKTIIIRARNKGLLWQDS